MASMAEALSANVHLKLWAPPGDVSDSIDYLCTDNEAYFLADVMRQGGIVALLKKSPVKGIIYAVRILLLLRSALRRVRRTADVFHINWLQCALSLPPGRTPALVTVLGSDLKLLDVPFVGRLIRSRLKGRKALIAPNAPWMEAALHKHFGDVAPIKSMVFGIDQRWYDIDRKPSSSPRIWLVVLRITRKKMGKLFEWGEGVFDRGSDELHLLGPKQEDVKLPSWIKYHGPTFPDALCSNWFPRATGMITLSEHDEGRPQVLLEALAAGLPIIASNIPAHENLLAKNDLGMLCNTREDFMEAVNALKSADTNALMSQKSRTWTKQHIGNWHDAALRYIDAYNELLADGK